MNGPRLFPLSYNFFLAGASFLIYASVLRPSFKYLDSLLPGVLFLLVMTCVILLLKRIVSYRQIRSFVESRLLWFSVITAFAVITFFFYPLANGLKTVMGGWDQDDCLILGVENLLEGQNPYADRSYFGNPCSPGFGALALYLPFVVLGMLALAPIVWMAVSQLLVLYSTSSKLQAGLFLGLVSASPMTLELLVNGSDILVMGFGLVVVGLLLESAVSRRSVPLVSGVAVLIGLVASMRVNVLLLLAVTAVYLYLRFRPAALLFVGLSAVVALVPSAVIYFSDPANFTPLHLVGKSQVLVPPVLFMLMAIATLLGLAWGGYLIKTNRIGLIAYLMISFTPHIATLAFSPLIFGGWDFFNWEAGHYLYVLTPGLAYLVARVSVPRDLQ